MPKLLKPKELCERWGLTDSTLRKWRVANVGPDYIKLGEGRNAEVRYRIEDVEAFEKSNRFVTDKG